MLVLLVFVSFCLLLFFVICFFSVWGGSLFCVRVLFILCLYRCRYRRCRRLCRCCGCCFRCSFCCFRAGGMQSTSNRCSLETDPDVTVCGIVWPMIANQTLNMFGRTAAPVECSTPRSQCRFVPRDNSRARTLTLSFFKP